MAKQQKVKEENSVKFFQHDEKRSAEIIKKDDKRKPYAVIRIENTNVNTYSCKNLDEAQNIFEIILGVFRHQDNPSVEEIEYRSRIAAAKQYEQERRAKLNDGYGIR